MCSTAGADATRPRPRRRRGAGLVAATLAASVAGATLGCGEPYGAPVRVVVPAGSTFRAATDSLARARVVRAPGLFRLYAKLGGRDRDVKAGTYMLQRGASWNAVLTTLTEGKGVVNTVTIPEGFALSSIVPLLASRLSVPAESVEAAVRDSALRARLEVPAPTLEGYLFPDTYSFAAGTSARDAVEEMTRGFERRWRPEWDARLQELAMSRNDVMALASIIEKEARLPEERPVISAVYHNRLKARMPLQADPTVQYALGRHVDRVLYKDLEVSSAYNTYKHAGLPPGPIASPGLPSIEAALYPANVPYRFFVATPDGHHEFRTTFSEHREAIGEIRKARRAEAQAKGGARQR